MPERRLIRPERRPLNISFTRDTKMCRVHFVTTRTTAGMTTRDQQLPVTGLKFGGQVHWTAVIHNAKRIAYYISVRPILLLSVCLSFAPSLSLSVSPSLFPSPKLYLRPDNFRSKFYCQFRCCECQNVPHCNHPSLFLVGSAIFSEKFRFFCSIKC